MKMDIIRIAILSQTQMDAQPDTSSQIQFMQPDTIVCSQIQQNSARYVQPDTTYSARYVQPDTKYSARYNCLQPDTTIRSQIHPARYKIFSQIQLFVDR